MGIITSSFPFMLGAICGAYIAQEYNLPNIQKLAAQALSMAKQTKHKYLKPKKPDEDDF